MEIKPKEMNIIRKSVLSIPILSQVQKMRELFPHFLVTKQSYSQVIWEGRLSPGLEMDEHLVRVIYKIGKHPKVFVPSWDKKCKHRFEDGSLCLYYCKDKKNWHPMEFIAKTIIPWSSQWLFFNELYNITGIFGALEVRH